MNQPTLPEKISLEKIPVNSRQNYQLDHTCPWVHELSKELEEELVEDESGTGQLHLNVSLTRDVIQPYGNYLLFEGGISGEYFASCVRCLVPTKQVIDLSFSACFLSESHQTRPEYCDLTTVYIDGQERELYFHNKGLADLREVVHENIFMNTNPLPLHDPYCRGFCPVCGVNLNQTECPHSQKKSN